MQPPRRFTRGGTGPGPVSLVPAQQEGQPDQGGYCRGGDIPPGDLLAGDNPVEAGHEECEDEPDKDRSSERPPATPVVGLGGAERRTPQGGYGQPEPSCGEGPKLNMNG